MRRLFAAAALAAIATAAVAQPAPAPDYRRGATLEPVAAWPDRQITGAAVGRDGRIFVNLPRWHEDVPISVAEVLPGGALQPYPNEQWNAWRNTRMDQLDEAQHFVAVQNIVFDGQGFLWVIDTGSPGQQEPLPNAAKLVKLDTRSNTAVQTIAVPADVAIPGQLPERHPVQP